MDLLLNNIQQFGTDKELESSRFQVMLIDKRDMSISPLKMPTYNRFFENVEERNSFFSMIEHAVLSVGGKLAYSEMSSTPLFKVFNAYDQHGKLDYAITIYRTKRNLT